MYGFPSVGVVASTYGALAAEAAAEAGGERLLAASGKEGSEAGDDAGRTNVGTEVTVAGTLGDVSCADSRLWQPHSATGNRSPASIALDALPLVR